MSGPPNTGRCGGYTGQLVQADYRTNGGANGDLDHAALPAAGPVRVLERQRRLLPALALPNALAVASGGFLAGVVALATFRALRTRRAIRRGRKGKAALTRTVVGKRSFLVDVHLLKN
jgi:hypothetical protein